MLIFVGGKNFVTAKSTTKIIRISIPRKLAGIRFRWFYVAWLIISKILILTQAEKGNVEKNQEAAGNRTQVAGLSRQCSNH